MFKYDNVRKVYYAVVMSSIQNAKWNIGNIPNDK